VPRPRLADFFAEVAEAFRTPIDMALRRTGSYFLTYHRYARREQVEAAYSQFAEFPRRKESLDLDSRLQSDWWRQYSRMFAAR